MKNKEAIRTLELMLYEHECNAGYIDFDSEDEDEIERADMWLCKKEALEAGITALKLIDRL